ncbi:MAG TPA: Ig-like domain-containing protein, partial [Vicinamibacterales bacterium]
MQDRVALGVALILIGGLTACGGSPAPAPSNPTSAGVPASSKPALTGLRVVGPTTLAPGASAQYKVTATYSDGSSLDVTSQSKWTSANNAILAVTATGLATAGSNGLATVTAAFGTLSQGDPVVVVPTGLYMLQVVAAEDQESARLDNVLVQVVSGPVAATTDWDGMATLFGVPQDAQLSFTKNGYQTLVQPVHLDSNFDVITAQLIPSGGRLDLTGQYQLSIDASNCSGDAAFPQAAKTRTYAASVQNATTYGPFGVSVTLSGANFALGTCPLCGGETMGNSFGGQTEAADGRFTLIAYSAPEDWNDGIYPNVVEGLADGTFLAISGQAIVTPTPNGFAGTLNGAFAIYGGFVV